MMETFGKDTAYRNVETGKDGDIRRGYSLQGCTDEMETFGKDTAYRNVETRWRNPGRIQLTGM